jgi:hypothetical protein
MARPDPWDAAVNDRPEPNPMPSADEEKEPMSKASDLAMSITLGFLCCSVIGVIDLALVLVILKAFGVIQ